MAGHSYREDRTAQVDTVKRIMLDPLEIEGVLVDALFSGEYVRYTVHRANGDVWIPTADATYGTVFTTNQGVQLKAWGALIRTPATLLPAGASKETLTIKWEYRIGAADDKVFDRLEVGRDPV